MPKKVDEMAITRKVVSALISRGPASETKLARIAGTTSAKKVRQVAQIAGAAAYVLASHVLAELDKVHVDDKAREAVRRAIVIPNVIEIKDAPDVITLETMPVYEAKLKISQEVAEGVMQSGVVSETVKGKPLKVEIRHKMKEKVARLQK